MNGAKSRSMEEVEVSICMCAYNRAALLRKTLESFERQAFKDYEVIVCEDGDDGGWTRGVCDEYGVEYTQRQHRPDQVYSNPAIPWNMALRLARGETIILQNPECEHVGGEVIEKLVAPHRTDKKLATFASVMALNEDGTDYMWYCHPALSARPFFFCGALSRETVFRLRGFDEDFGRGEGGYGYDDDDFAFRLQVDGVRFSWLPPEVALVRHMWHPRTGCPGIASNERLFRRKVEQMTSGKLGVERNLDREWGMGECVLSSRAS